MSNKDVILTLVMGTTMQHGEELTSVMVDGEVGDVLGWNELDETFSRGSVDHLTDAQRTEAKRLAGLVWAGTHYVAGGRVFTRSTPSVPEPTTLIPEGAVGA